MRRSHLSLRVLPLLVIAIGFTPRPAAAVGGINLSWDDCGAAGASDKLSTCLSNIGVNIMVGSFTPPAEMPQFSGMSAVLDLTTDTDPMVAWWNLQPGGCRVGSVSSVFDFVSDISCFDVWAGAADGGMDYSNPVPYGYGSAPITNHAKIRIVCAIPGVAPVLADGTEYYLFKVRVTNANTTGAGNCAGCPNKACIVFNQLLMTQRLGAGDYLLSAAISSARITWQGDSPASCNAVPARNRTWGQVKSLYR